MSSKTHIHTIYKLASGERVPSVTTILGVLAKPAIIHWAWECGVKGLDYRKVRDEYGDTGTLVHARILCDLSETEFDTSDYSPTELSASEHSFSLFQDWKSKHKVVPKLLETPLVSEDYRYGGTIDFYGKVDGVYTLLDFKTSNAIYRENTYQLAAYMGLLNEKQVEEVRVLRFPRALDEGLEDRMIEGLDSGFRVFLSCLDIYRASKESNKVERHSN